MLEVLRERERIVGCEGGGGEERKEIVKERKRKMQRRKERKEEVFEGEEGRMWV